MIRWYKKATYIEHWMANTECLLLAANAYLIHRLLQKMRLGNKNYDYKRFPTVWSILAEFWTSFQFQTVYLINKTQFGKFVDAIGQIFIVISGQILNKYCSHPVTLIYQQPFLKAIILKPEILWHFNFFLILSFVHIWMHRTYVRTWVDR